MQAVIAGFSRSPFHFAKKGLLANVRPDELAAQVVKGSLACTQLDPALLEGMGDTAENVAQRWAVSRADQEALAVESHRKAAFAREFGRLDDEIVPITTAANEWVTQDGCIRPGTNAQGIATVLVRI